MGFPKACITVTIALFIYLFVYLFIYLFAIINFALYIKWKSDEKKKYFSGRIYRLRLCVCYSTGFVKVNKSTSMHVFGIIFRTWALLSTYSTCNQTNYKPLWNNANICKHKLLSFLKNHQKSHSRLLSMLLSMEMLCTYASALLQKDKYNKYPNKCDITNKKKHTQNKALWAKILSLPNILE